MSLLQPASQAAECPLSCQSHTCLCRTNKPWRALHSLRALQHGWLRPHTSLYLLFPSKRPGPTSQPEDFNKVIFPGMCWDRTDTVWERCHVLLSRWWKGPGGFAQSLLKDLAGGGHWMKEWSLTETTGQQGEGTVTQEHGRCFHEVQILS